jgi:hypothetical protein
MPKTAFRDEASIPNFYENVFIAVGNVGRVDELSSNGAEGFGAWRH